MLLIALPLLVYRAHVVRARDATPVDRVVWALTQPARALLTWAVEGTSDAWARYVDLRHAREALGRTRMELRQLGGRLDALEAVEAENRALRLLLEIERQGPEAAPLAARVLGGGFSASVRTLSVDRGAVHGVRRGQPVVDATGLIGLVQRTGWTSAEVVMLVDPRSTVLARVARSRVLGRVRGTEEGRRLVMEDVSRDGDVEPGDLVVTSGMGRVFPPNIPIGRVVSISEDDRRRRLELDPAVDFERIDWVSLLPELGSEAPGPTPQLLRPPSLWPALLAPDVAWSQP